MESGVVARNVIDRKSDVLLAWLQAFYSNPHSCRGKPDNFAFWLCVYFAVDCRDAVAGVVRATKAGYR